MTIIIFKEHEKILIDRKLDNGVTFRLLRDKGFMFAELNIAGKDIVSMWLPNVVKWNGITRSKYKQLYQDILNK